MNKNDVVKLEDSIVRILDTKDDKYLVIDCKLRNMCFWINKKVIDSGTSISEDELLNELNINLKKFDELTNSEKKIVLDRYGTISSIVTVVSNNEERNILIDECSRRYNLTKCTIRRRLCDYLAINDICIFLPNEKKIKKELTKDEKNFRWALNKYYYKSLKLSLKETYRRMLKDKYMNEDGLLKDNYPSFRKFNYYFYKTVKKENLIISREGKGDFMRNHRALLGGGIRDFCNSIGYGMLDSTICDIYLVNEKKEVVGRPTMTACIDGYSSMCLGYSLGFYGGVKSLRDLVKNICCYKVDWCKKFNFEIEESMWDCCELPHKLITDKGKEYTSEVFSQITDLGVEVINLPPYRPDLKGAVEKFFDVIQNMFKKILATRGVIFEDYQERGAPDYRKKASLTLEEFEQIILMCIDHYNSNVVINLPYELVGKVGPYAYQVWNYCKKINKDNLIKVDDELLRLTLLPRTNGKFRRNGLIVNKSRYKNLDFKDRFIEESGECVVAYDPNNVSNVWLYENGNYYKFDLIERWFNDMTLDEVKEIKDKKKEIEKEESKKELQTTVDIEKRILDVLDTWELDDKK